MEYYKPIRPRAVITNPRRYQPGYNQPGGGLPLNGEGNFVTSDDPTTVYQVSTLSISTSVLVNGTGPVTWETIRSRGFLKFARPIPANTELLLSFHMVLNWGSLTGLSAGTQSMRIGFYETVSWDPTTLTWNNQPALPSDTDLIIGMDHNYESQVFGGTNVMNSDALAYRYTVPRTVEGYVIWLPNTPPNLGSSLGEGIIYADSVFDNHVSMVSIANAAESKMVTFRQADPFFFFTRRTLTTASPHGLNTNDKVYIIGVGGDNYDFNPYSFGLNTGTVQVESIIDDYTFTYLTNDNVTEAQTACTGTVRAH